MSLSPFFCFLLSLQHSLSLSLFSPSLLLIIVREHSINLFQLKESEWTCQNPTGNGILQPTCYQGWLSTICQFSEEPPGFKLMTGTRTVLCFVPWHSV
jgi:hypothetical protein